MDKTPDAILTFAAKRAQDQWNDNQQPYLLARLSPDLLNEGINYKEVLGEQRLQDFLRASPDRLKVVVHPSQKAKIGLVPTDKEFEFPATPLAAEAPPARPMAASDRRGGSQPRYVVTNFLQLLSELDDADAAQVQIPTHILTKLMRDR